MTERRYQTIQPTSPQSIYRSAIRATVVGLVTNVTLGAAKFVGGILGGSIALISDAVNSLGDALTSIATLVALVYSQRPPDELHPYGHTRAESVAASHVSLVIILTALYVGWEAISNIKNAHGIPPVWTLWLAGANVIIKESLYYYTRRIGLQTGSSVIIANAWDHRSDALCSMAVVIGLAVVRYAGPSFIWADEAAAIVVAGVILWSGSQLFRNSASELLDPQADSEYVSQLRKVAEETEGVRAVEKLWVRKTGIEYFVDIHVQVDGQSSVEEGHVIAHEVRNRLVHQFPTVRDVLTHLEPFNASE